MIVKIPWYSVGRLGLVLLCLILVLIVALMVLPIRLDITAFKGPIEGGLTSFMEAPSSLEKVYLRLSLWPTLTIEGIDVEGSGWEKAPRFSHIDLVEVQFSVPALLGRQLKIKKLHAFDLDFHAQRTEDTPGNWPVWTESTWEIAELADIELERVTVFLDDHDLGQADLHIDRLEADIAYNRPLALSLQGRFEGAPVSINASGPTLKSFSKRASDFSLALSLQLSDLELGLEGTASRQPDGVRYQFELRSTSEGWEFLRPFTDSAPPPLGEFDLTTRLSNRAGQLDLQDIEGTIGASNVHGALTLAKQGPRPQITGKVVLDRIVLDSWLSADGEGREDPETEIDLSMLDNFDADLEVAIRRVEGPEWQPTDVVMDLELNDGLLSAPVTLAVDGNPVSASLTLDTNLEASSVSLSARVEDLSVEQLRRCTGVDSDLRGSIDQVTVDASTRGRTLGELIAALTVEIDLGPSRIVLAEADRDLAIDLDRARIVHQTDRPMTLSGMGSFLGAPFRIEAQTAPVDRLVAENVWPIELRLEGSGTDLGVVGEVHRLDDAVGVDVDFEAAGEHIGDLNPWLGVSAAARMPYHLRGHLSASNGSRQLDLESLRLGRSQLAIAAQWTRMDSQNPVSVDLLAATLDLEEIGTLFDPVTRLDSDAERVGFDLPIVPNRVSFDDADIELEIDRLLRRTVDLTEIEASLTFRHGRLEQAPFSFSYSGLGTFGGQLDLDLQRETPRFKLSLSGHNDELGQLLELEQIVESSPVSARGVSLEIEGSGSTIHEILQSSDIFARFDEVRLTLPLPGLASEPKLRFERIDLSGPRDRPLVLAAEGVLDQQPVRLHMEVRIPADKPSEKPTDIAIQLEMDVASTHLDIDGHLNLPLRAGEMDLELGISGADLSSLSQLLEKQLPALGPYRLHGDLTLKEGLLSLADLDFEVHQSSLHGDLRFDSTRERPRLEAILTSPLLRTTDLIPAPEARDEGEDLSVREPSFALDLDLLERFNARIDLAIATLETRHETIEGVSIETQVENGGLELTLLRPQENRENAELRIGLHPVGDRYAGDLILHWDRKPYGLLADLFGVSSAEGSWSVRAELSSTGADSDELLANLDGYFDLIDYPASFKATIFDLWGGGLINSVLPVFKLGQESRLNCTVGRFRVEKGVLTPETLLLDTTRSRVRGKGTIDLGADRMKLTLKPRPKQRNLINLSIPVIISGAVTDPSIRVSTSGLAVTWFRLSLWIYTVWRDLLRQPLPTDGSDICVDPPPRIAPSP